MLLKKINLNGKGRAAVIYEYSLDGLSCAACAEKIEREVGRLGYVQAASLNLAVARLSVTAENPEKSMLSDIQRIVRSTGHGTVVKAHNAAARRLVLGKPNEKKASPTEQPVITTRHDGDHAANDHANDHAHSHGGDRAWLFYLRLGLSVALFAVGAVFGEKDGALLLILAALVAGFGTIIEGIKGLIRFNIDESLLMSVAAIAACFIGEYREAAMVLILNFIGGRIEGAAARKSRKSIEKLTEIRPDTARLLNGEEIPAEEVAVGAEIVVRPFERIPLDGVITFGATSLDAAAITGESVPIPAEIGAEVLSGMLNGEGLIHIKSTALAENSAAARIIKLVEDSAAVKGKSESMITRFAKIYTPAVMLFCLLIAVIPPLIWGDFSGWLYKALAILVASCPCALVISVPLAFFAGIGAASKKGVLIKGGKFVEKIAIANAAAFDKTGTVTDGRLQIDQVFVTEAATESDLLSHARIAEYNSAHPMAKAIVAASDCEIPDGEYNEIAAAGVVFVGEKIIFCGGKRLMEMHGIDIAALPECQVYVAVGGELIGGITFSDRPRETAKKTLTELKTLGVEKIALLTGDNENSARKTASAVGVTEVHSKLLPEDKVALVKEIQKEAKSVIFVGDGVNDAPVLAAADVGFAMGLGSDAAIEAADAVLTGDSLNALPDAIKICKKTVKTVRFNIAFPLIIKAAVMISALIYPIMWLAVAADVCVMIITALNAARLIKK